jgi:hypothetical protein
VSARFERDSRCNQPALMTSTPVGYQRSPCLKSNNIVLLANVRKYSPSSTCVPSLSRTKRTGSEAGTPSLSFPKMEFKSSEIQFKWIQQLHSPLTINSSKLPTTRPFLIFLQLSQIFKGLFPRDSCEWRR